MRGLGREEEDLEDTVSHLSIYLTGLDELYREQAAQLKHHVGVPTRGPGSQLVNAVCFLVPDDDARGNTVTHGLS